LGDRCTVWLGFLGKLTFHRDFHIAATFGIGNVRNTRFTANIDPKLKRDLTDFRDSLIETLRERHIFERIQRVGGVHPHRMFDRLERLSNLPGWFTNNDGSACRIFVIGDAAHNFTGFSSSVFRRFNIDCGTVFKRDWRELSHVVSLCL